MEHFIKRHRFLLKSVAITVVCLFMFNGVAWAYPDMRASGGGVNLQAQSILNPILKEAGWENAIRIRLELKFIVGMSLKVFQGETVAYYDINAGLDEWASSMPRGGHERKLKVVSHPGLVQGGEALEVVVERMDGSPGGDRFSITTSCRSFSEIEDVYESLKIRKIDAIDYSAILWPEVPGDSGNILKDLHGKISYIRGVVGVLCNIGDHAPTIWAKTDLSDNVLKITLEDWLLHGPMATFEIISGGLEQLGMSEKEVLGDLIKQYREYHIKVQELIMIIEDCCRSLEFLKDLPEVQSTRERPVSHEAAILHLMKEFLSRDRDERLEAMRHAASLVKSAIEDVGKYMNVLSARSGDMPSVTGTSAAQEGAQPKDSQEKKGPAGGSAASDPGRGHIEKPMLNIAPEEIRNILVFSDIGLKLDPKVGEMVIELWALVTSLHRRYPDATIYVTGAFPDIFMARQFKGKIKAIPRDSRDLQRWGYDSEEWKDHTYGSMGSIPSGKPLRARFIAEKQIDMVVDSSLVPGRFRDISTVMKRDFPDKLPPHVFSVGSVMRISSAGFPKLLVKPPVPLYTDRGGKVHNIEGIETVLRESTSGGTFNVAGLWQHQMALCRILGLDVDKSSLATIQLEVEEAIGALELLKQRFYSMEHYAEADDASLTPKTIENFDPSKKIIVVNVYAVTHQFDIVDRDGWVAIIRELVKNVNNAYFVFTRGGIMDTDLQYVGDIMRDLRVSESEILLPKADDIYPVINDILGISSGIVTIDTGLSHVGSAVYGIPAAIMTTDSILHWLTPGDNVHPVIIEKGGVSGQDGENTSLSKALEKIREYADHINNTPERPAARSAKASAASPVERARMDKDLYDSRKDIPDISTAVRTQIKAYIEMLGIDTYLTGKGISVEEILPEVAVVDSIKQTGVGIPRFNTKLYTPEQGKEVLMIDKSCLERFPSVDGPGKLSVRDKLRPEEIIHEVLGHLLARRIFPDIADARRKRFREDAYGFLAVEEELLAHFMTLIALYKLNRYFPSPDLSEHFERRALETAAINVDGYIRAIVRQIANSAGPEQISLYRYREVLSRNQDVTEVIKKNIRDRYMPELMKVFSLAGDDFHLGIPEGDAGRSAESLLANVSGLKAWKVLTFGSTFFHELGHYLWARAEWRSGKAGKAPIWSWSDVFSGKIHNVSGNARRYGGIAGNMAGTAVGALWFYLSLTHLMTFMLSLPPAIDLALTFGVSAYLVLVNLISFNAESWGEGDLGHPSISDSGSISEDQSYEKFDVMRDVAVEMVRGDSMDEIGEMSPMTLGPGSEAHARRELDKLRDDIPALTISRRGRSYRVIKNESFNEPTILPETVEAYRSILQRILETNPDVGEFLSLNYPVFLGYDAMSDFQRVLMHRKYERGSDIDPVGFLRQYAKDLVAFGWRDLRKEDHGALKRLFRYRKFKIEYLRKTEPGSKAVLLNDRGREIRNVVVVDDAMRADPMDPAWHDPDIMLLDDRVFQLKSWRRRAPGVPGEKVVFASWRDRTFMFYTSRSHTAMGTRVHQWRNCDLVDVARRWFVKRTPENVDDLPGRLKIMLDEALYSGKMDIRKIDNDYFYKLMGRGDTAIGLNKGVNEALMGDERYERLVPSEKPDDEYDAAEADTAEMDTAETVDPWAEDNEGADKDGDVIVMGIPADPDSDTALADRKRAENDLRRVFLAGRNILKGPGGRSGVERYLMSREGTPIDIVVDASLIPRADIVSVARTWSYLMFLCRDLENVNFVFRNFYSEEDLASGSGTAALENGLKYGASRETFMAVLREELIRTSARIGSGSNDAAAMAARINGPSREGAIEILICSRDWLEWKAGRPGEELGSDQYAVAMEGDTSISSFEVSLRDYHSALVMALATSALVIAERNGELEELINRTRLLDKINSLYSGLPFESPRPITPQTLRGMISPAAAARLRLAIELALPPMVRGAAVKQLERLHESVQLALMAA